MLSFGCQRKLKKPWNSAWDERARVLFIRLCHRMTQSLCQLQSILKLILKVGTNALNYVSIHNFHFLLLLVESNFFSTKQKKTHELILVSHPERIYVFLINFFGRLENGLCRGKNLILLCNLLTHGTIHGPFIV